ncbi:hypothetical protein ETU09_05770 [Apibacter muscae]|uniref:Uncharacterized protein n=1 Tax=Apibacter muscae TaxID=2509004 RepID=A0A563DEP9_9FLAO|nr:hypothetical protein [Apibacter muscae]TWP28431.1 hypothetical protein ETU09_05770 [Apibacter muscae]
MTFEEFRKELIQRVRKTSLNQFIHLYIKAKDWGDILRAFKKTEFYEWSFNQNIIDFDLLNEIPEEEREKENYYNRKAEIKDFKGVLVLLNEAEIVLSQKEDFRCQVVMFGNSKLTAEITDKSMVELEQYHNSEANIGIKNDAFLYATQKNESKSKLISSDFATVRLILDNGSLAEVSILDESFLNSTTLWFSQLVINNPIQALSFSNLKNSINNHKVITKDKSQIIYKNE